VCAISSLKSWRSLSHLLISSCGYNFAHKPKIGGICHPSGCFYRNRVPIKFAWRLDVRTIDMCGYTAVPEEGHTCFITLAASGGKRYVTVWRPSVCLCSVGIITHVAHQGGAWDTDRYACLKQVIIMTQCVLSGIPSTYHNFHKGRYLAWPLANLFVIYVNDIHDYWVLLMMQKFML